jgi:hypothetical protein
MAEPAVACEFRRHAAKDFAMIGQLTSQLWYSSLNFLG